MDQGQSSPIFIKLKRKDNSTSDKWRVEGNEFYKKSDFYNAMVSYNKAITFAERNEVLSLAYGNRSAAYFEAKKYRECIDNIKLARECGYPTEKLRNLNEREEKCLKLIENGNKKEKDQANHVWNFFKLSYPVNKKIPWIIEGLKAEKEGQYSKGVYATQDLKAGDIIAIEDISMFRTYYDGDYKHCANCFKTNMLNLIPCLKTANYMYCSTQCRNEFYHYADSMLLEQSFFKQNRVYLIKMRDIFGGFPELVSNTKPKSRNLFDFDFSDPKTSQYNKYKCLITSYDFPTYIPTYNFDDISKRFFALDNFLFNYLLMYNHTSSSSPSGWVTDGTFFSYFGYAIKSSCTRNVNYICIDNKCIFYVEKPIKAGKELFISLAGPWYSISIEERKSNILTKDCKCVACTEKLTAKDLKYVNPRLAKQIIIDYPPNDDVLPAISTAKNRFDLLNRSEFNVLTSMERRFAIANIIRAFQYLAYKIMFP